MHGDSIKGFFKYSCVQGGKLHGRSDSNARHLVLETSALPTELHPYHFAMANIVICFSQPNGNYSDARKKLHESSLWQTLMVLLFHNQKDMKYRII